MFWRPALPWRVIRWWLLATALLAAAVWLARTYLVGFVRHILASLTKFVLDPAVEAIVEHFTQRLALHGNKTDYAAEYWNGFSDLASYITAVITLVGVTATFIAVVYGATQARIAVRAMRRSARQEQMRLLIDLDLVMVNNPDLMVMAAGRGGLDEASLAIAKSRAFSHAMLNTFDTVFDYYHTIDRGGRVTHWKPWEAYLISCMADSAAFRTIVREAAASASYTRAFKRRLAELVTQVDADPAASHRIVLPRLADADLPPTAPATIRELGASKADLAALETVYRRLYVAEFPDPDEREALENMRAYLGLKHQGWYGANNYHILLAESDGLPVGMCVSDYAAEANAGIIEFLVVAPQLRGSGLGRRLLDSTERLIAADAAAAHGRLPAGIAAEMNDPFQVDLLADNHDPFDRAALWHRWGFQRVRLPYVQPALSEDQAPVECLLLLFKPIADPGQQWLDPAMLHRLLHAYLTYAMRIDQPERNPQFAAMAAFLASRNQVRLQSLGGYIGRDPTMPWRDIHDRRDRLFAGAMRLYRDAFGETDLAISDDDFAVFLDQRGRTDLRYVYHLWVLPSASGLGADALASFFTLTHAGFGGYVARRRVRGVPALPSDVALASVEERMRRDNPAIEGWFIECDPNTVVAHLFHRHGFHLVALDYRQPPLPGSPYGFAHAPRLQLLYKPFGDRAGPPSLPVERFLAAVADIFEVVYGVAQPLRSPYHLHLRRQLAASGAPVVTFQTRMASHR